MWKEFIEKTGIDKLCTVRVRWEDNIEMNPREMWC